MGYIDVLPTLMEIAGYEGQVENELDGINVLDAMRGENLEDRNWFTYFDQRSEKIERLALSTDEWKLIWERNAGDNTSPFEKTELYRIDTDKIESVNIAEQNKELVLSLQTVAEHFYRNKVEHQNPRYPDKENLAGSVIKNWTPEK